MTLIFSLFLKSPSHGRLEPSFVICPAQTGCLAPSLLTAWHSLTIAWSHWNCPSPASPREFGTVDTPSYATMGTWFRTLSSEEDYFCLVPFTSFLSPWTPLLRHVVHCPTLHAGAASPTVPPGAAQYDGKCKSGVPCDLELTQSLVFEFLQWCKVCVSNCFVSRSNYYQEPWVLAFSGLSLENLVCGAAFYPWIKTSAAASPLFRGEQLEYISVTKTYSSCWLCGHVSDWLDSVSHSVMIWNKEWFPLWHSGNESN